jgi:hypothetical protein
VSLRRLMQLVAEYLFARAPNERDSASQRVWIERPARPSGLDAKTVLFATWLHGLNSPRAGEPKLRGVPRCSRSLTGLISSVSDNTRSEALTAPVGASHTMPASPPSPGGRRGRHRPRNDRILFSTTSFLGSPARTYTLLRRHEAIVVGGDEQGSAVAQCGRPPILG